MSQGSSSDKRIGAINETAPTTDTEESGLNGRLQRVAQNITELNENVIDANESNLEQLIKIQTKNTELLSQVIELLIIQIEFQKEMF